MDLIVATDGRMDARTNGLEPRHDISSSGLQPVELNNDPENKQVQQIAICISF